MNQSQNEENERLEYCKALIEMACRENPEYFPELVKAALKGIESAQRQEAQRLESEGVGDRGKNN
jgi:hypothetical protein